MQDKVTYEYAVIRLVPKVEREEFLNIGVILFSKRKKYLGIKYHLDAKRIKAFAPDIDLNMIRQYLEGWEKVCKGAAEGGPIGVQELPFRFRWLVAPRSTMIQSSRPHPGLCKEPEKVLGALFEQYVL
jgi:hypothetical protein